MVKEQLIIITESQRIKPVRKASIWFYSEVRRWSARKHLRREFLVLLSVQKYRKEWEQNWSF